MVAGSAGTGAVTSATGIPVARVAAASGITIDAGARVGCADVGAAGLLISSCMAPRIPPQL
jgi:hypothetical protein